MAATYEYAVVEGSLVNGFTIIRKSLAYPSQNWTSYAFFGTSSGAEARAILVADLLNSNEVP